MGRGLDQWMSNTDSKIPSTPSLLQTVPSRVLFSNTLQPAQSFTAVQNDAILL